MATPNDARVVKLQHDVEAKRTALAFRSVRFTPVTNCSVELDGVRFNLHQLDRKGLVLAGCKLQALKSAATTLAIDPAELVITGFKVDEWLGDVRGRMEVVAFKDEEAKLKKLESKLKTLLSADKRTELELDEIEELLK